MDIQASNGVYTWTNKRKCTQHIASRLDRFLISDNAIHLGGDFHAYIMREGGSDHWPIMLQWSWPGTKSNKPFRVEALWFSNPNFKAVVSKAWKSFIPPKGAKMFQFQHKLKNLKQVLKVWNHTQFSNIFENRKKLEQQMCSLQQNIILEGRTEEQVNQEQILWNKIETCRQQEETLWRQKSRIRWLKEGEKNTKFFHRSAIQIRMHNNIAFINNRQGERLEAYEDMEKEFKYHFQEILKEPPGSKDHAIRTITQHIPKIITKDHNNKLLQSISM